MKTYETGLFMPSEIGFQYTCDNGDVIAFSDIEVRALKQLVHKLIDLELFDALTIRGAELCSDEAALLASIRSFSHYA